MKLLRIKEYSDSPQGMDILTGGILVSSQEPFAPEIFRKCEKCGCNLPKDVNASKKYCSPCSSLKERKSKPKILKSTGKHYVLSHKGNDYLMCRNCRCEVSICQCTI